MQMMLGRKSSDAGRWDMDQIVPNIVRVVSSFYVSLFFSCLHGVLTKEYDSEIIIIYHNN
jgi:hypothetical protein